MLQDWRQNRRAIHEAREQQRILQLDELVPEAGVRGVEQEPGSRLHVQLAGFAAPDSDVQGCFGSGELRKLGWPPLIVLKVALSQATRRNSIALAAIRKFTVTVCRRGEWGEAE